MSFTVIDLVQAPERLKGALQRRMLEVREGLFIGNLTTRVRDEIWVEIRNKMHFGSAIMLFPNNSETGFAIRTHGKNRREPVDNCGIWLVKYKKHFSSTQLA
ncbi:MAG: type I-E CRISPR-associated endoribonuclease Cas2 [Gammaproteobacteria bacterium]|nr:type I-E CRISPR-associated endoribonuclease Cas2 [Gammaproteobacteria bacterium]